ncbi:MAG: hypothetical protein ACAI38_09265 [Myxococcota bacterium]
MKHVVLAAAALAVGFVAGHFLWPMRKIVREAGAAHASRWRAPPVLGPDGTPTEAPPELWTVERVMQAVNELSRLPSMTKRAEAVRDIIPHIETADSPELAPKLAPLAHDSAIQGLYLTVLGMWSEGDPEAAVRYSAALKDVTLQMLGVSSTFHAWAQADLTAASKFVDGLPQGPLRTQCSEVVLSATALVDPKRALQMAATLPPTNANAESRVIYATWARNDLDGALKAAMTMPEGKNRNQAVESIMTEWVEKDAAAALDWAVKHNAERGMGDVLQTAFSSVAVERPDLAAGYIAKLDDGKDRDGIIGTLAIRWAGQDREAAKRWALGLDDNDRTLALEGLVGGLQYDDPASALDLAKSIDDPKHRGRNMASVISAWADREPELAWKSAQDLPPGREKDEVIASVIGSLGRTNPMAAADALTELEDAPALRRAAGEIARSWADVDPQAAVRWVERLPEGEAKQQASSMIAATWAENDPVAAAAWVESRGDEATKRDLALTWASSDPQAAVEWAMQHGGRGEGTFDQAVSAWAANDPRRAAAWASSLPRGKNRDTAYEQLSENTLYDDPETAMGYVQQIGDATSRDAMRARMYAAWQQNDPKGAEQWRAGARLSPAELAALETPPDVELEPTPSCVCPPTAP